jgi:hypothetical protein
MSPVQCPKSAGKPCWDDNTKLRYYDHTKNSVHIDRVPARAASKPAVDRPADALAENQPEAQLPPRQFMRSHKGVGREQ